MPINAHPEYLAAEKEYLVAQTLEDKIEKLKKMISLAPAHKGAENLRAQLKTRLKKLLEQKDKNKKSGKSSKQSIKKEEMQAVIIGETNTGKSSLLNILTNVNPQIADYEFTTKEPLVGMMDYRGSKVQLIDVPAIESEYYDKGIVNSADVIIMVVTKIEQIPKIRSELDKSRGIQIVAFNKADLLNDNEKRKTFATLQSKRYNFVMISVKNKENIQELKDKMFRGFGKIRVYTKEPGKEANKERPLILEPGSTVKEVAEKILKGFSSTIRETRIWGPSSKFPGQKVGLKHKMKDLDIVEFKTR
jgi:hypothetical protein